MALRAISLFAGGGGLDLGVERACGARTVVYVEREAYAAATLAARMEEGRLAPAPIWSDVSTFDGRPWSGVVDLIHGGFPCQDVSNAGKRAGIDGERSGLWSQYARIVGEVRPRFVFVENVAALATRGLDRVAGDLAALGFDAEWCCLGADSAGAPHGRARLFLLAHSRRERVDGVQPEPKSRRSEETAFGGAGSLLADTGSARLEGPNEPGVPRGRAIPSERGERVADADGLRCDAWVGYVHARESDAQGSGSIVAHAHVHGRKGERLGGLCDERHAHGWGDADRRGLPWPPGPSDGTGWSSYLDRWPNAQPAVRRGADGVALAMEHRVDRLRLLGNGVVPDQAAAALLLLAGRLLGGRMNALESGGRR